MIFLINILLITITLIPKVTMISVNNSATGIRIEDLLLLGCIFLLFLIRTKHKNTNVNYNYSKIKKVMFLYLAASIISTIYALIKGYVLPVTSFLFIIRRLEYFLLYYLGYYYATKKTENGEKYFNFIVICHTVICLLQMMGLIGSFNHGEMLSTLTQGRISSTFNGAYEMSAFLLLLLPYYVYNSLRENKLIKNIFYIVLITFCIVVSASRTSLILEIFIIFYILIKNNVFKNKKVMQRILVLSLFIIIPVLIFIIPRIDFSRYINLSYQKTAYVVKYAWNNRDFNKYVNTKSWYGNSYYTISQMQLMGYDESLYVRVSHWMQLIDGWISSPLIGVGVSIAGTACDGNYVKILTETGLVGLCLWIYLLCVVYKGLKNSKWLKYSFITIVLGAALIDLFDASKVMMFFWFLLGMYLKRCEENTELS